jgi:hypothetical protein
MKLGIGRVLDETHAPAPAGPEIRTAKENSLNTIALPELNSE